MKQKIYEKLKQDFAHLGLGNNILSAHADALNAMGLVNEENLEIVVASQKSFLENLQKENDRRVSDAFNKAKINLKEDADNTMPEWYEIEKNKTDNLIKQMQATIGALTEKNEMFEKQRIAQERTAKINNLAKELGIPKYRIDEGFAIAESADDEAIKTHLTSVANNIKTQMLPSGKTIFPMADGKVDKATADSIAESLI